MQKPLLVNGMTVDQLLASKALEHGGARAEETAEEKAARETREQTARDADAQARREAEATKDEKKFTQADVDRMTAREKDQGRRAATQELATKWGVSLEEAERIVKAHQDTERQQMSEAERALADAKSKDEAATADRDAAKQEKHDARVERLLARAGLPLDEDEAKAATQLGKVARLVDVEVGADEATVATAIAALKTDMPNLFTPTGTGGGGGFDPGRPPAGGGTRQTEFGSEGARVAKERFGDTSKQTV